VPFVTAQSIVHVLKGVRGEDVIIPRTQYGFEALQPVYSPSCLAIMLTRIGLQSLKVTDLLPFVSVRGVGEHPAFTDRGVSVFTNINVEEDLSLVQQLGDG